ESAGRSGAGTIRPLLARMGIGPSAQKRAAGHGRALCIYAKSALLRQPSSGRRFHTGNGKHLAGCNFCALLPLRLLAGDASRSGPYGEPLPWRLRALRGGSATVLAAASAMGGLRTDELRLASISALP